MSNYTKADFERALAEVRAYGRLGDSTEIVETALRLASTASATEARLAEATRVLEFYADPARYPVPDGGIFEDHGGYYGPLKDRGDRARAFLRDAKPEGERDV